MDKSKTQEDIIEIINSAKKAVELSQKLFGSQGLFSILAPTVEEKRKLVETDLFKSALRKLSQLQKEDIASAEQRAREMSPPVRVTVTLPRDLYLNIKNLAKKEGVSISEVIREKISKHRMAV